MSTTVFPLAGDTVTVAAWSDMIAAIDRGATDPLSSLDNTSEDTARYQFDSNTSGNISNDTFVTLVSMQVDEGQVFLVDAFVSLSDSTTSSPGDSLDLRISAPTGARVTGISIAKSGGVGSGAIVDDFIDTTSTQVIQGKEAATPAQTVENRITMVVVGDTGGGEVALQWAKSANLYTNTFTTSYASMTARRIW